MKTLALVLMLVGAVAKADAPAEELCQAIATGMSPTYPKRINRYLTVKQVQCLGTTYIMFGYTVDPQQTLKDVANRQQQVNQYCTDPNMEAVRQNGVSIEYRYFRKDGQYLDSVSISPEDCQPKEPNPRLSFAMRQLDKASDPQARAMAALILGATKDPAVIPALCEAQDDPSPLVRQKVQMALRVFGGNGAFPCPDTGK